MSSHVTADTEDFRHFVENGASYFQALETLLESVRFERSVSINRTGFQPEINSTVPFERLAIDVGIGNLYVDTIRVALDNHQFSGDLKSAPNSLIDAALVDAGLDPTDPLTTAEARELVGLDPPVVGDDALLALGRWMADGRIGFLPFERFEAMVITGRFDAGDGSAPLPDDVLQAARHLYANPQLFLTIAELIGPSADQMFGVPGLHREDLLATLQVNRGLRALSDPSVFQAVDADGDGGVTWGEINQATLELPEAEAAELQGLLWLGSDQLATIASGRLPISTLAGTAEERGVSDGVPSPEGTFDDALSYDDVVGATINLHAFANDPDGAYQFVTGLPTAFDDLSGLESGFDYRLVDDDGLRAVASAALAGADSFTEQTLVVAHLPESEGAVRNGLITAYYAEIAQRMNHRLNGHLDDPLDPSLPGHSGAHWAMMAPHASNGVRPVITAELTAFTLAPSDGDRQAAADGNQYIFGTIAPTYAAFLEAFPAGRPVDQRQIEEFFNKGILPIDEERVFGPGTADLRDGFVYYAAALDETDPARRQELVFTGNLLLATFEQAGAQNLIEAITDLDFDDDGWRAAAQIFTPFIGGDEAIATDQMRLPIGIPTGDPDDDAENLRLSLDVPARDGVNNQLIGTPLIDFDPTATSAQVIDFGDFTVGLDGTRSDVTTERLHGWDAPPIGSNMEPLPTSVADWAGGGDGNFVTTAGGTVFEGTGSGDGTDLAGTAAIRWNDWEERQWYITNLFHQFHTDPAIFTNLADFEPGRPDLIGDENLTTFLPQNALVELATDSRAGEESE